MAPKLLDRVRHLLRLRHYSTKTERAYLGWVRRYILFHGKRHPEQLGAPELTEFLSFLAVDGRVSASTQNQALNAILFMYRHVLGIDLGPITDAVRARQSVRLPVVLTRDEVRSVPHRLDGTVWLIAALLYGSGLRLGECLELRVKDRISPAIRSSCGVARVPRTGGPCCRGCSSRSSSIIWTV